MITLIAARAARSRLYRFSGEALEAETRDIPPHFAQDELTRRPASPASRQCRTTMTLFE